MESLEVARQETAKEPIRLTGKVTTTFPAKRYGFLRTEEGEHYFMHLSESPAMRKLPPVGAWVTFTPVPVSTKKQRAIRCEVV